MNDERWHEMTERIRDTFKVTRDIEHALEPGPGRVEEIEFEGPGGRMRLERVSRPVVLERRAHFSKRASAGASEEFVYSDSEMSHRVTFYRWVDDAWQEEDFRSMMPGGRR